jgi:hypothetical protein
LGLRHLLLFICALHAHFAMGRRQTSPMLLAWECTTLGPTRTLFCYTSRPTAAAQIRAGCDFCFGFTRIVFESDFPALGNNDGWDNSLDSRSNTRSRYPFGSWPDVLRPEMSMFPVVLLVPTAWMSVTEIHAWWRVVAIADVGGASTWALLFQFFLLMLFVVELWLFIIKHYLYSVVVMNKYGSCGTRTSMKSQV